MQFLSRLKICACNFLINILVLITTNGNDTSYALPFQLSTVSFFSHICDFNVKFYLGNTMAISEVVVLPNGILLFKGFSGFLLTFHLISSTNANDFSICT